MDTHVLERTGVKLSHLGPKTQQGRSSNNRTTTEIIRARFALADTYMLTDYKPKLL